MTTAVSPAIGVSHPWSEKYWPIHLAAFLYMLLIGGFSVFAWLDVGEGFRAAMCAGAQVLAVVCAILARRAFTAGMGLSGLLALIFAGGCAYWAAQGLEHAWQENGQSIDTAAVVFLAALEPGLFLLAEHIEQTRAEKRDAQIKVAREEEEMLRRVREREEREAEDRRERLRREAAQAFAHGGGVTKLADHRKKQGATIAAGTVAAMQAATPAHATAPNGDAQPPAIVQQFDRPATAIKDIDFQVVSRFGDAMTERGERVSFRSLSATIGDATGIAPGKLKGRIERVLANANVRIGERWPRPGKPLAA